ncbi:MAG: ABC transporter permease subunit [bacterium]|nr:ABC transporter permease subunit [bacterium]
MGYISEGFVNALELLFSGDQETYSAIINTLKISTLSICGSLLVGIPAGFMLGYFEFPGKRALRTLADTLLALPTVAVGLIVYAFISSMGPLGELGLLFTIPGTSLAQMVLVTPIVISLTATAIESLDPRIGTNLLTLGAQQHQVAITSLLEARYAVLTAIVTAYGRAISEVGISMMIGGNIKWHTRTITTAIALETGKGQFAMGIALALVLIFMAFCINWFLSIIKRKR